MYNIGWGGVSINIRTRSFITAKLFAKIKIAVFNVGMPFFFSGESKSCFYFVLCMNHQMRSLLLLCVMFKNFTVITYNLYYIFFVTEQNCFDCFIFIFCTLCLDIKLCNNYLFDSNVRKYLKKNEIYSSKHPKFSYNIRKFV